MTRRTNQETKLSSAGLFEDLAQPSAEQVRQAQAEKAIKQGQGAPRLLQPNRSQIELRASDLESLLAQDHRARLVWGYVMHQDLSRLIQSIKARGSTAGPPMSDYLSLPPEIVDDPQRSAIHDKKSIFQRV